MNSFFIRMSPEGLGYVAAYDEGDGAVTWSILKHAESFLQENAEVIAYALRKRGYAEVILEPAT